MIRGLLPNHSRLMTAFIILFTVEFIGFSGYVGGFYDKEGRLDWLTFQWDTTTLIYTILMWCSWLLVMTLIARSKEVIGFKIGAGILASLPMSLFGILFIRALQKSDIAY